MRLAAFNRRVILSWLINNDEFFSALFAAAAQYVLASAGFHAGKKAVLRPALSFGWLISSFTHGREL